MREKKKSEKAGLKLIIQKTKTVTSGHITSWQMDNWLLPIQTKAVDLFVLLL